MAGGGQRKPAGLIREKITSCGGKQMDEIFYKRQRLQPGLGFLSPAVFEQRYYAGLVAA
jgi:hypothetical protein